MVKRYLVTLCVLFGGLLAAAIVYQKHPHAGARSIAFSANATVKRFAPNGIEMSHENITVAIRRNGSASRSVKRYNRDGRIVIDTKDVQDRTSGIRVFVDEITHSSCTMSLNKAVSAGSSKATYSGSGTEELANIIGYRVFRTIEERAFWGGKVRIERWVSPDLGGYVLRQVDTVLHADGRAGAFNIHEVVSLTPGEPDERYFAIPSYYVERSPSVIAKLTADALGSSLPPSSVLEKADIRYRQQMVK